MITGIMWIRSALKNHKSSIQVNIPRPASRELNILPGDQICIKVDGRSLILTPIAYTDLSSLSGPLQGDSHQPD